MGISNKYLLFIFLGRIISGVIKQIDDIFPKKELHLIWLVSKEYYNREIAQNLLVQSAPCRHDENNTPKNWVKE